MLIVPLLLIKPVNLPLLEIASRAVRLANENLAAVLLFKVKVEEKLRRIFTDSWLRPIIAKVVF